MAAYLQAVPECAREASKCSVPAHVPVTVISGVHQPPELLAQHGAMATNQVTAPVGAHFIHLDEPELVSETIRQLVQNSVVNRF